MTDAADLIGYADPLRKGIGFLIPVFDSRDHNALLVQRLAADGRIAAFEPVEALDAPITYAVRQATRVGEEAIWAFAFAASDILAERGMRFREALHARIDDQALADRPLLSIEVAEFLDLAERRIAFAKTAYERLLTLGTASADSWRDLSILTPDLRYAASRAGGEIGALAARLVARIDGNAVTIWTADPVRGAVATSLAAIARRELDTLSDLYIPPRSGWTVRFSHRDPRPRAAGPDALVLLAEDLGRDVGHYLAEDFGWRVGVYFMGRPGPMRDLSAFNEALGDTGAAGFVVVRGEGERRVADALRETAPGVVAIQFGTKPRYRLHDRDEAFDMSPPSARIYVPATGLFGSGSSGQNIAATVRQIAAATLAAREESGPRIDRGKWVYFRANGSGPEPDSDALAVLYDRLLANDLSVEHLLFLPGKTRPSRAAERYPGWAYEALFASATPLRDRRIAVIMDTGRSKTDAGMLLPVLPKSERDWEEHRRAVERVLSFPRWHAKGRPARAHDEMPFDIDGPSRIRHLLARPEPVHGSGWT
jgi:hypothetical protein